jgi:release factor glutamine methyltransferase
MTEAKTKKQWTILELIQWTTGFFQSKGIQSPRLTAELLLAHALGIERISLYIHYDKPLNPQELATFKELIQRRVQGEPAQYLIGKQEFWSMEFTVTPDVLIPRPETELLVETVLRLLKKHGVQGAEQGAESTLCSLPHVPRFKSLTIADIGTGSGNIAIALAKELRECRVYASDISESALQIARYNAKKLLESPDKITFLKGDLLQPLDGLKFNAILSNLPYISEIDYVKLAPEVNRYEPKIALLGGKDGLIYYRRLLSTITEYLSEEGYLLLEIGFGQRDPILQMLTRTHFLTLHEVVKDYAGIDRVVVARRVGTIRP